MKAIELNAQAPYATESELVFLFHLAESVKPKTTVMLGAGPGVMALAVIEGYPKTEFIIVDNTSVDYVIRHLLAAELPIPYYLYISDSSDPDTVENFSEEEIDLLIVDADHTYAAVQKDIAAWLSKVAVGGYIFFHDYDHTGTQFEGADGVSTYGVKQAVDEVFDPTTGLRVGTALVIVKP